MVSKSPIRLTWTHYRIILQEPSTEAREWYEQEAACEMWSTRTLQRNVSSQYYHRLLQSQDKEVVRKEMKRTEVQAPVYDPNKEPIMDNVGIKKIMPHRYPMQLVDKIVQIEENDFVVGIKNVTANEPFFVGHFPEEPVMPGVLQIEAMAQCSGILVLSCVDEPERYSTYFMKIDNVKFRQKVVPGDTLIFHVSFMTPLRRGIAQMKGYAFVGDKIVSECEFMAQIIKNK